MTRVAVLFSGRGSNLKAILEMAKIHPKNVNVVCAVTDNVNAPGIIHAWDHLVPVVILSNPKAMPRDQWERSIITILRGYDVHLVVLAGFMRVLHDEFCKFWHGRCINIHPSLLPKYPGLHTHKRVLEAGDEWHGCSVHYVTPEVDGGPIISQVCIKVSLNDTEESLGNRVLEYENKILPEVVLKICKGEIFYEHNRIRINGHK
jgi:phosphoribosylglycinamide formyltransferase-1